MKPWVYVAGPLSSHPMHGTHEALRIGRILMEEGFVPYVPHLTTFWDIVAPMAYEKWMLHDMDIIERMDCVLRLPGRSSGADAECDYAISLGKPVFYSVDDLIIARGNDAIPSAFAK